MRADSNAEWILSQVEKYDPGFLGEPDCGNDICEYGEDSGNCAEDCPVVEPECGNDVCEDGETEANCADDCATGPDPIWTECGSQGECPAGQFCIQVSQNAYYCTISCDDLELGGGCGYQDMACVALQDGGGACVPADIECGDGLCEYGETADSCQSDCAIDCGDLSYEGCCDGTQAVYCNNGQRAGRVPRLQCRVVDGGSSYYFCTDGAARPIRPAIPVSREGYILIRATLFATTMKPNQLPWDSKVVDSCGNDKATTARLQ